MLRARQRRARRPRSRTRRSSRRSRRPTGRGHRRRRRRPRHDRGTVGGGRRWWRASTPAATIAIGVHQDLVVDRRCRDHIDVVVAVEVSRPDRRRAVGAVAMPCVLPFETGAGRFSCQRIGSSLGDAETTSMSPSPSTSVPPTASTPGTAVVTAVHQPGGPQPALFSYQAISLSSRRPTRGRDRRHRRDRPRSRRRRRWPRWSPCARASATHRPARSRTRPPGRRCKRPRAGRDRRRRRRRPANPRGRRARPRRATFWRCRGGAAGAVVRFSSRR